MEQALLPITIHLTIGVRARADGQREWYSPAAQEIRIDTVPRRIRRGGIVCSALARTSTEPCI